MAVIEHGHVLRLWRGRISKSASEIRDWTQQELAQFFRVEWALGQAGISVESDRGISDEGDPWFAFCRARDGEVIIHIAREGQVYVLAGFLSDRIQRGCDFNELVERLLAEHPAKTLDKRGESNVIVHPATMLALLVLIAFMNSSETRASTVDAAGESALAVPLLPLVKPVGSVRPTGTLAAAIAPLTATFELSQAMTILRVVSLLSSLPAVEHDVFSDTDAHADFAAGAFRPTLRIDASSPAAWITKSALHAHTSQAGDEVVNPLANGHTGGVEKLLEAVAKLWTYPDAKFSSDVGLTADAAAAFFSKAGTADEITIASSTQPKDLHRPLVPLTNDLGSDKIAPSVEFPSSLTITQTSETCDSIAQTVLKLSLPGQGNVIIYAAMLGSSDKLYETVSALVERAKDSSSPEGDGTISLAALELTGESQNAVPGGAHSATPADQADGAGASPSKAAAPDPHKPYTTVIADGVVKHVALDNTAQADVERAIAAFKEDVGQYSIAVNGRDVIFYSSDAVINHSNKVVVELWQFQDGSSIGLVGLSVDGHLPYSL